jgi:hypothetical protein
MLVGSLLFSILGRTQVTVGDAVSVWLFEEGSGTTAVNSVAGGIDGTIYGDPQWIEGVGGVGQALEFDGKDDYVEIENNPLTETVNFTIQLYINPSSIPFTGSFHGKKFFSIGLAGLDQNLNKILLETRGEYGNDTWELAFIARARNAGYLESHETGVPVPHPTDQWYHIAVVSEAISTTHVKVRYYVDHEKEFEGDWEFTGFSPSLGLKTYIGVRHTLGTTHFTGFIDNVILHKRALTLEEFLPKPDDVVGIENNTHYHLPCHYTLYQNFPNPFNPETQIRYLLPFHSDVSLKIYNLTGQHVRTLVQEHQSAGKRTVIWDGTDDNGIKVSSGIYLYEISAGDYRQIRRMVMLE